MVFIVKGWLLVFVMMWVRWTLPRLRIDQVMMTCLKYLLPISCVLLLGVSAVAAGGMPTAVAGLHALRAGASSALALLLVADREGDPADRHDADGACMPGAGGDGYPDAVRSLMPQASLEALAQDRRPAAARRTALGEDLCDDWQRCSSGSSPS